MIEGRESRPWRPRWPRRERGVFDVFPGLLPVHRLHVPAVRRVTQRHVLRERHVRVVLDRDLIRVVDHDEVAELLMPREGGRLAGDALLKVAVRGDDEDAVIERTLPGSGIRIEQSALVACGVGEADRRGQTLTERPGGDLHAVGVTVLGVPRRLGSPRAQRLEVVELEPEAPEVELDVLSERRVTRRQDEPVPAGPVHVGGIVVHHPLVEQVRGGGKAHRRAGVAVAHLLDRVRRQHASGIHRAPIDFIPTQFRHRAAFLRGECTLIRRPHRKGEEQPAQARVWSQHSEAAFRLWHPLHLLTRRPTESRHRSMT